MKTIFKYEVSEYTCAPVSVPSDAKIIHFGPDPQGRLCFWAEVNPDLPLVEYNLRVYGTGQPIPKKAKHLMSCRDETSTFMWHLYELPQ